MKHRPKFETWDQRRGERTSCAASEARSACRNDRGRLLTIYAGDQIVASYRDGKDIAADQHCPQCGEKRGLFCEAEGWCVRCCECGPERQLVAALDSWSA